MKALKVAAVVLAALSALLAGAAAYVASPRFAAQVKAELVRAAQQHKQRTLAIDGELELFFWPSLGFKLGKAGLSERASDAEFASIEGARLMLAAKPLLERRLVVEAFEANGLKATLIRRRDGTLNIDDLFGAAEPAGAPLQIDIPAAKLADATLTWRDEQAGSTTTLAGLALATTGLRADTGSKAVEVAQLDLRGHVGAVQGTLAATGIAAAPSALTIARLAVEFDAKAGESGLKAKLASPLAADLTRRTLRLEKLAGTVRVTHPRLPARSLELALAAALSADLARQSAGGRVTARLLESRLALDFKLARLSPPALKFELAIDQLDLDKLLPANGGGDKRRAGGNDLALLRGADVNGVVRIGRLHSGGLAARNFVLRARSANGKLDLGTLDGLSGK